MGLPGVMTKRFLFAVLLSATFAMPAAAGSYTDFNAGIAAFKRGDNDATLTHLNAALAAPDLNPAFRPAAYFDRARVFAVRKQWSAAIADLSAAIAADPLYLDADELRAECYIVTGQLGLATADLTEIIRQKPGRPQTYGVRGDLYMRQGNFDAAIADYTQMTVLEPDNASPYAARSYAYRRKGDADKAVDDLDKAIRMDSQRASYFMDRGGLYQMKADYRRAAEDYKAAAALAPSDATVVMQQGIVAWKQGDLASANDFFAKTRASSDASVAPYAALWSAIAAGPGGAGKAAAANRDKWPGPILDLYYGNTTMDRVLAAAAIGDAETKSNQLCEANFYGGEWYSLHGKPDAAKPMLSAAAANCPEDFVERGAAVVALQKSGQP